ncbi:MAG: EAL domain-containing protein [Solirubrobacterales bacterium]
MSWSDQMFRVFGHEIGGIVPSYESYILSIHPDDRPHTESSLRRAMETFEPWEETKRAFKADGTEFLLATQGRVQSGPDGKPARMIGVCGDVTSKVEAEQARSQLAAIVRSSHDAITSQDCEGRFISWSPGAERVFGFSADEVVGRHVSEIFPGEACANNLAVIAKINAGFRDEQAYDAERLHRDGTPMMISVSSTPVLDVDGKLVGVASIARDVTEIREAEAMLRRFASVDSLTGLLNRRRFLEELDGLLKDEHDGPSAGAILMLDLDNFKYVNDAHGHPGGDELLRSIARMLTGYASEKMIVARLGGDEFGVLLPGETVDGAVRVANDLLKLLHGNVVRAGDRPVSTTASIGITTFVDRRDCDPESLLSDVDRALYEAKDRGRDRYFIAAARTGSTEYESRLDWEERIRTALLSDGFTLYLQPIIELSGRKIVMYEALIRMVDGHGITLPGSFLGLAERLGLIKQIDRWVVGKALDMLETEEGLRLSVNVSASSLEDNHLIQMIQERLAEGRFEAGDLMIEMTETEAIVNVAQARTLATKLDDFGCGFALDDFGTGFGSFAYLKRIPASCLKIDGDFVSPPRSRVDDSVIEVMVDLAKRLGKLTVAEYVEDEATLEALVEAGVDFAQGFHIGRPEPAEDVLRAMTGS